jgi:glycosyltransferase involved in cell wall biosynthesis
MAYIISVLTGIPWSFTLHRWDIKENNILKEKAKSAKFIRCISKHGKKELLEIIGRDYDKKITIIHSAVKIPAKINEVSSIKQIFTIVTPANLLEVKGHKYLIDACSILINRGIKNFQCIFYGNGPMQNKLEHLIKEKKLTAYVKISGCIPHEELIKKYQNKEVNLVILPSITTNHKEHEGIPVSLMEAMAYGIPTISTNTGGIPELLSNGAGILVEEKSSKELAQSIVRLMRDKNLYRNISQNGYQRVNQEFNIEKNVKKILRLIKNSL